MQINHYFQEIEGPRIDRKKLLYLVNAWASENKLVLEQFKTFGKGHEIAF
jgi:hypothetical protein